MTPGAPQCVRRWVLSSIAPCVTGTCKMKDWRLLIFTGERPFPAIVSEYMPRVMRCERTRSLRSEGLHRINGSRARGGNEHGHYGHREEQTGNTAEGDGVETAHLIETGAQQTRARGG